MEIFVNNMPAGVNPEDVTELFTSFADVLDVKILKVGNPDHLTGVVHVSENRIGAEVIARKLNGTTWRHRTIQTYVPLFQGH